MNLSFSSRPRAGLFLFALGLALICTNLAVAAELPRFQLPQTSRGFQTTMAQQAYYRLHEQLESAAHASPNAPVEVLVTEPRYVTLIGPNGGMRTFVLEGVVTIQPRQTSVVHYGANR